MRLDLGRNLVKLGTLLDGRTCCGNPTAALWVKAEEPLRRLVESANVH